MRFPAHSKLLLFVILYDKKVSIFFNRGQENVYLKNGLNVHRGNITHAAVATTLGYNHLSTI